MKSRIFCVVTSICGLWCGGTHHATAGSYPIVGTAQTTCYDNARAIVPPQPGQRFYGQDAQFPGRAPSYTLGPDGRTVRDNVTGLTWQRSPDWVGQGQPGSGVKMTFAQARALPAKLNAVAYGGFHDWRLPTIKELYSLILFNGTDPSGPGQATARLHPFIDTHFFKFAYGDARYGERIIDSQFASSTTYSGWSAGDYGKMFGVNFADGRIKGYDLMGPPGRGEKTFFVLCVRGNPAYGKNDFHDNGNGTITDRATDLMWAKTDSGLGLDWESALAWVQARNSERYLGHADWRLPNAKELQSIVDYMRSPDATASAAIDPVFRCTQIVNETGEADFPFYWTGTTHASSALGGGNAVYVALGRAAGWMPSHPGPGGPPEPGPGGLERADFSAANVRYLDVHGAGAQRSDPKRGDPAAFPRGRGPQGDVIRIYNYVRLVRNTAEK